MYELPPPPPAIVCEVACTTPAIYSTSPTIALQWADEALLARAQCLAERLGGAAESVRPFPEERELYAFFELPLPSGTYFLKLPKSPEVAARWREPETTSFAAMQGWAPQTIDLCDEPDVLLTRLVPAPPLTWDEASKPQTRAQLLGFLRQMHGSLPVRTDMALDDPTTSARGRLQQLRARDDRKPVINLDDLEARLDYISGELADRRVTQTFCHRDFHNGNILRDGNQLYIIDWEYADWADPLMELARFFVLSHIASCEVATSLHMYLGYDPSPEDVRHVQLCMAALHVEFFVHRYRLSGLENANVLRFLQGVLSDSAFIPGLPRVRIGDF